MKHSDGKAGAGPGGAAAEVGPARAGSAATAVPASLGELARKALGAGLGDALRVVAGCVAIALVVNAWIHPEPLRLVAQRQYEVLVPCPEPGGEVTAMAPDDIRLAASATFAVDARAAAAFAEWHLPGARNIPYDYLEATPPDTLRALARAIARSRARQVAVYGDGDDPDTGELLGREISGHGIRNVHFVAGGAAALRRILGAAASAPGEPEEGRGGK